MLEHCRGRGSFILKAGVVCLHDPAVLDVIGKAWEGVYKELDFAAIAEPSLVLLMIVSVNRSPCWTLTREH